MSLLDYLRDGLLEEGSLKPDSASHARGLARAWVAAGVDPASVELLAEYLARIAAELGPERVGADELLEASFFAEPPQQVCDLLSVAATKPLEAAQLAALAVHLVDIAEAMALRIFIPELPALTARADRTGEAARMVGLARHLKG